MKTSLSLSHCPPWIRFGQTLTAAVMSLVLFTTTYAQDELPSESEAQKQGPLTLENLIGNSVRITSSSKYPEIEKAIQRFKNGDVRGAEDYLEQAADKYPKLPPVDIIHAKMQLAARNGKAVRVLLERSTAENPDDPEAFLMLADQAYVGGRTTEALALFELAAPIVEKFSGNSFRKNLFEIRVIAGRSAIAERRKQWEEAKALLEEWLERDPKSAAAFQRLGVAMFNLKDTKMALQHFQEAKKLDDKVNHPFVIMATLFAQQDNKKNAQKAFERAYKDGDSEPEVAQAFAKWLIQEGNLGEAKKVASKLRSKAPESVAASMLDAIISMMQSDRKGAQEALESVLQKDISHADAMNMLSLLLIESDKESDRKKALQYAQMNAQRFADNGQANITFGYILYKLGMQSQAKAALQRGQQAGNPTTNSQYLLARIAAEQDSPEQKKRALEALRIILDKEKGLFLFRNDAEKLIADLENEVE